MEFAQHLTQLIRAGYQAIYIATSEEARCEGELGRVAEELNMELVTWDAGVGFSHSGSCNDPVEALNAIPGGQFDNR
jgi:hypothetical protein